MKGIRSAAKGARVFLAPAVMAVAFMACGGAGGKALSTPLGTYEILESSSVPEGLRDFHAQDLSAAREDPTGVLRMAYEGAVARFAGKHGREPGDDLEIAAAICDWVAFHLRHPYFYPEDFSLPRFYVNQSPDPKYDEFFWDPVKIISYTLGFDPNDAENWPSPLCTQQNFAAAGIMNYAGLHARLCYVENHDGLEYYSWKYRKWIWCEATFNEHFVLPSPDGASQPLGARELQELTLFGGIQNVQMVKHGYPDGSVPQYNYLEVHPHGFRRYAPMLIMRILNGTGNYSRSPFTFVSVLPVPDTYTPAPGEWVELETDPISAFSVLPNTRDPLTLDAPLDALTVGDNVSLLSDALVIDLRTWLPYAASFEVRHGDEAPWETLEQVADPTDTARTSSRIRLPWTSGIVSFRATDRVGNTSETFTILLRPSSS